MPTNPNHTIKKVIGWAFYDIHHKKVAAKPTEGHIFAKKHDV
jgi:hypothetical protein